ncbi:titin [Drosophila pseudoobscura]|uniref:Glycerol-3-phosphate dehydrogenase [NAD(+)] n=1 Tax=Drosophila pseudoobscura pseudoobscura TaxID=46245 RepID=A0A6I8VNK0_DROPS|nr:titin [Drosophila pseudoobscura]
MVRKLKVCIIGSEGWGSAIAASVSKNVQQKEGFDSRAHIYVYDELVHNKYLSEVMNNCHENIKYLPGIRLPDNLIAVNDILAAAQNADIMIFATPQHFVKSYCNILAGHVKKTAIALSMVKGLAHVWDGEIDLFSNAISKHLGIPCYSMMSAKSAIEMAQGKLCEITIGCNNENDARLLVEVLQTENCRVTTINDVDGVELCGTLKDIIALGAGFVDGLKLGENARVAAIHLGIKEMMRFTMAFFPSAKMSTFFESCAVANSVASTYVDKNVTFAKSFITSGKTIQEIEATLLNGRKLLGPLIAAGLNDFLEMENMQDEFPLFTVIHRICQNEVAPHTILETLRTHPDLSDSSFSQFLFEESIIDDGLENVSEDLAEPLSALEKALNKTKKKKSFRELTENGSWNPVYDANKAKKHTLTSPWHVNEKEGLQISGWLESNDSSQPTVASGTQGSGDNDSIVGSTSGSDDCRFNENADAENVPDKTKKDLPVDKTWLRDQPPPMIIGSDDKGSTKPPFQDSNSSQKSKDSMEKRPRPFINTFQGLNIKSVTGKPKESASSGKGEVFPNKLTKPPLSYTKDIRRKIESFTSQSNGDFTPEPKNKLNASKESGKETNTDMDKATKGENSKMKDNDRQPKPENQTENANLKQAEILEHDQTKNSPKVPSEKEPKRGPEHKFVFESLEDKERFESIIKPRTERLSRADDSENMKQYTQTLTYMLTHNPAQNLEVSAVDNQLEKANVIKMSDSTGNKEVPIKHKPYSLTEESFRKWKQVEAEERPPKHLQAEDNMYLSVEEMVKREMALEKAKDKAVPRENNNQDSLAEEKFEKWKEVEAEAEETEPKHSQIEENKFLSPEEIIRTELEDHRKQELETAADKEIISVLLNDVEESKPEMITEDEEMLKELDKRQVLAEERENDVQRQVMNGEKKPHQSLDEANHRCFSNEKKDGQGNTQTPGSTGDHEWDWLQNKENPETENKNDGRFLEYYVNKKNAEKKLEKLNNLLQEVFHKQQQEADARPEASGNSVENSESGETAQKKRDAQQPQTPVPKPGPVPAKAPPSKRQKIPEGSPQFQGTPRSIPPPSPQTLPLTPQEQQPLRKDYPIQFEAGEEPTSSHQTDDGSKAPPTTREASNTPSPSDQKVTKKMEAPIIEVRKHMPHFLKRDTPKPPPKKVDSPPNVVKKYEPPPNMRKAKPQSDQGQRENTYEVLEDPRSTTEERKPLPKDNPPSTANTEKPDAQETQKESQPLKVDEVTEKLRSLLRKDQDKKVGYKGKNPFLKEPDLQSKPPMDTSLEHDLARRRSDGSQSRRKVVVKPPFNPPFNPRVRKPGPPFDGRDREYHTLPSNYRFMPRMSWPLAGLKSKETQTQTQIQTTLRTGNQANHLAIMVRSPRQMQLISPPTLEVPLGLFPRYPSLNKLLCAVQLGLLASFLARYRRANR